MRERRSEQTETGDESRVDLLLNLLGDLWQRDPSPALRERLAAAAAQRLSESAAVRGSGGVRPAWLKPAFAVVLLAAIGFAAAVVFHFREPKPVQTERTARLSGPAVSGSISQEAETHVASVAPASVATRARIHHAHSGVSETASTRRMTMQLPYSNSAIDTGTGTTIRVSMSQSELLSLGFPINATVQDRRIATELTLGDDGLPRAISLPLPLEVMKEKR